jgi:hypothetical protein
MPLMMALYSTLLVVPVQLNSPNASGLHQDSIHHASTLHRPTKLHNSNPNHRLNHPGKARHSGSFHNPSQVLNFHSDNIRHSSGSLPSPAMCMSSHQLAHGLETICYYTCHGHLRSIQVKSTSVCPHTLSERAF